MGSTIEGKVTVLSGSYISADVVLPARYSFLPPAEMAEHVLEDLSLEANAGVRARPIIIAGEGFGYGTGRESPARGLRAAGVKAIVGGPFARIFFRNCVNNGVLMLDCPTIAASGIADDDLVRIDVATGEVRWKDHRFSAAPVPQVIQDIVAAGSLIDYGREIVARSGKESNV